MIARLTGKVVEKGEDAAVVDVHGVGYLVHLSAASLLAPAGAGEPVALRTITHVREDALDLFGFATEEEEDVFRALVEVKGVGPRAAQNILSGIEPRDLAQAVAAGRRGPAHQGAGRRQEDRRAAGGGAQGQAAGAGAGGRPGVRSAAAAACSSSSRRRSSTSATSRRRPSRWPRRCAARPRARGSTSCCARRSRPIRG